MDKTHKNTENKKEKKNLKMKIQQKNEEERERELLNKNKKKKKTTSRYVWQSKINLYSYACKFNQTRNGHTIEIAKVEFP